MTDTHRPTPVSSPRTSENRALSPDTVGQKGVSDVLLGIDIVEIDRVARILRRRPAFRERYFGPAEQRLPAHDHPSWYATCLAAKEAFVKALGVGVLGRVPLRQVQLIVSRKGPRLECGPQAQRVLADGGIRQVHVSIAKDVHRAMAWVVLT